MFQFARFAFYIYEFNIKCRKRRVSPFGNPRIKVYSQLPRAYRSVLRPSSPLGAKASTKCTFIAWNIICTEINLHMMIKFSVWWFVKLFQTTLNTLLDLVEVNGIEPMTSCLQSRRSPNWATPPSKSILANFVPLQWWARVALNYRPHAYQACALTAWATGPLGLLITLKRDL